MHLAKGYGRNTTTAFPDLVLAKPYVVIDLKTLLCRLANTYITKKIVILIMTIIITFIAIFYIYFNFYLFIIHFPFHFLIFVFFL